MYIARDEYEANQCPLAASRDKGRERQEVHDGKNNPRALDKHNTNLKHRRAKLIDIFKKV
jgi:hypothetical protein